MATLQSGDLRLRSEEVSEHMRPSLLLHCAAAAALVLVAGCTTGTPTTPADTAPTVSAQPTPDVTPEATVGAPTPTPTPDAVPTEPEPTAPQAPGRTDVAVVVTIAGQNPTTGDIEVAGYAETLDQDGRCTLTLTAGGRTVTSEQPAEPDVTSTTCGMLTISRDQLTATTWSAELGYVSSRAEGRSTPVLIEVR